MNITVIGATGMVGSRLVTEAASRGHQIQAASRSAGSDQSVGNVRPVEADAARPETLPPALNGADALLLAVRPPPGAESTLPMLTTAVLTAAAAASVPVLIIGGAGALASPQNPNLLAIDDPAHVPAQWRGIAQASVDQLQVCRTYRDSVWSYLSPPALLEPGTRTGRYVRGTTTLITGPDGTSRISAEDFAVAAIDEIERPIGERHWTVAEATAGVHPGR